MRLEASNLSLGYGQHPVVHGVDVGIPPGQFTAIIGPNACGKSTLLKGLARLLPPRTGTVSLNGEPIDRLTRREVARSVALLPQITTASTSTRAARSPSTAARPSRMRGPGTTPSGSTGAR